MTFPMRRPQTKAQAERLVNLGKTPRAQELDRYQAYYEGTQYDGRPLYLDMDAGVPRLERKPCVIYPLLKAAIESNTALAMGGSRFPRVLSLSSEDDSAFAGDLGLSQSDSETLDAFNSKLLDVCGLPPVFRQGYRMAQAARSVAFIGCYRAGLPNVDCVWAKLCEPTFDPSDPSTVVKLEIRYRYIQWQRDAANASNDQGGFLPVCMEYRRVIDATNDTVYVLKEIWEESDTEPQTAVATTIAHGFGMCPVRWYARQRESLAIGSIDGKAVGEGKLSEFDAINHSLSSRHLAALYTGDPIKCATGVDPTETLGTVGRAARVEAIDPTKKSGWDSALGGVTPSSAIKAGPGELWRASNEQAKLYYLALPKGALDALDKHISDLCSRVREALRYVWIDPEKLTGSGDVSGKTLAFVFSSQVNAVSDDRDDFGRNAILPVLGMLYRMVVARPKGLYIPGLKKALPILQRFVVRLDNGSMAFIAPQLQLKWGEFFDASDIDESTRVSTALAASSGGPNGKPIITLKTAVEHIQSVFAISNVDQYVDALAAEAKQRQVDAVANAAAIAKSAPPAAPAVAHAATAAKSTSPAAPISDAKQKVKAA